MIKLNLIAQDEQEERILAYLQENASETLADKINNGTPFEKDGKPLINKKTLAGFTDYAYEEARKLARKNAKVMIIDDPTVYGWAIHYFEEDSIEGTLYTIDGEEYKPMPKKVVTTKPVTVKPQPQKQQSLQFSLFDKFDENDVKEPTNDCLSAESAEMTVDTKEETTSVKTPTKPVVEENKGNDMYQKYMSYQAEYKTAIVAYRLGDFYEVFGDNAVTLGNELSLTITSRDVGLKDRIPMVGFPYHAAENYFAKIVKNHDLYIVENDGEKQFIERIKPAVNRLIDEDTGEILSEEEMREFDGDIYEPQDIDEPEPSVNQTIPKEVFALFGNKVEVR